MKTPSFVRKSAYSALVFFGTLGVLSAGYAGFVTLQTSDANTGKSLTSTMMQAVIGNLADLDTRVSTMSGVVSSLQASAGGIWSALGGNVYYTTGNVGIGTSTPSTLLHITNGTGYGAIALGANSTAWSILTNETDGSMGFWSGPFGSGLNRMMIKPNGNVGIGTINPGAKLDVVGTIKITDGTQNAGRILTSDTNGLASWTDPWYLYVTTSQAAGTVVSAANDSLVTGDITLTKGIWLLNLGYQMGVSATNGIWDVHIDAQATGGGITTLSILPNFNSETSYSPNRWGYLTTTQLVSVTAATATIHARRYGAYSGSPANYTLAGANLTMIATKVR